MAKQSKKPAMGRGLSALLKDPANEITSATDKNADQIIGNIVEIEVDAIEVNPFQPRIHFNEEALHELAASIKELGVIQPITVRKMSGNRYQLVSGERRLRASKSIKLATIPAYVRIANDQEMLEMALVENIQRKDLDPIEVALSYQRLIDEIDLTQEELSQRVGKKRTTVTNYLRLLKLDPIVQTGMRDGFISMGHGRALINIKEDDDQLALYKRVIDKGLSVRQTEELVQQFKNPKLKSKPKSTTTPNYIKKYQDTFSEFFGNEVQVKVSGKEKGNIQIPFHSKEDLARIKKLLK
jgi:ParB family chromosome partitioning protein